MATSFDKSGAAELLDVLVVGGGQAGLVMGYHLAQRGLRFKILDAEAKVGDAWARRWDSLKLFTSARYDNLPGMDFPAPADTYPGKDDVASFLRAYAARFDLPVQLDSAVTSLTLEDDHYLARTSGASHIAKQVVIATGPFQVPFIPPIAKDFAVELGQLHSADYRNPASVPEGKVLVVGGANTGCQIALELSESRDVEISVGQRLPTISQRPLNRDVWWWGTNVGVTGVAVASKLGRRLSQRDVVIGGGLRGLRKAGVKVQPRMTGAEGRTATFEDGTSSDIDGVVWATGYKTDHSWIDIPGLRDQNGRVLHDRGVTPVAGLYMLGLSWQHTRTSALLGWVTNDAEYLLDHIGSDARIGSMSPGRVVQPLHGGK